MVKICFDYDWDESRFWYAREEGERGFYSGSAFEIPDELFARYSAARNAASAACRAEDAIVSEIREIQSIVEMQREEERRRLEWEAAAPERKAKEAAFQEHKRLKKAAKKARYFAKYPDRATPGWSEALHQEKVAQNGQENETTKS